MSLLLVKQGLKAKVRLAHRLLFLAKSLCAGLAICGTWRVFSAWEPTCVTAEKTQGLQGFQTDDNELLMTRVKTLVREYEVYERS